MMPAAGAATILSVGKRGRNIHIAVHAMILFIADRFQKKGRIAAITFYPNIEIEKEVLT
jgi:hypothetical protein